MGKELMQKMNLVMDLLKIIISMAEQGEDYSLILNTYNDTVEQYNLPMPMITWISNTEFAFVGEW